MDKNYFNFMLRTMDSIAIQTALTDIDGVIPYTLDYGLHKAFASDSFYVDFRKKISEIRSSDTVFFLVDDLEALYAVITIPELSKDLIIGPVRITDKPQYAEKLDNLANTFFDLYMQLPLFSSYDQISSLILSHLRPIFSDRSLVPETLFLADSYTPDPSGYLNESDEAQYNTIQDRYETENDLCEAVTIGNATAALSIYKRFMQFYIAPRNANRLRNTKNMMFVFNTILRRAVMKAMVHPYYIDKLSGYYTRYIEQCTSESQLNRTFSDSMIRRYCMLVQNHSLKEYSKNVRDCISYIDFHYKEECSLKDIAESLYLNESYLSARFKKEMAMTITDYIHQVRIDHAILLLNNTHLPINDIATRSGYDDPNYFIRVFKKYKGITPKAYQKMIQK